MKKLEIRSIQTEIRELNEGSRMISGLAIPTDSRSELLYDDKTNTDFYETISKDAINDELILNFDIKLYVNHDASQGTYARSKYGVGSLRLFVTERGLEFETVLPRTAFGDQLLEGIKRGDYDAISFAFLPGKDEWKNNGDGTYDRTIRSFELLDEISILSCTPAYGATEVSCRSLEDFKEQERIEEEARKSSIFNKLDEKLKEIYI
jgi:HK97 family phage prohead protease